MQTTLIEAISRLIFRSKIKQLFDSELVPMNYFTQVLQMFRSTGIAGTLFSLLIDSHNVESNWYHHYCML
jgi:hypothetical protein